MTVTLASGLVQKHMDMGCILGQMETGMKANGECAWSMARDRIIFVMEIGILECIKMASPMGEESMLGVLGKFIQVIFRRGLSKVEESGGVVRVN